MASVSVKSYGLGTPMSRVLKQRLARVEEDDGDVAAV
jgi:hypothetical protein